MQCSRGVASQTAAAGSARGGAAVAKPLLSPLARRLRRVALLLCGVGLVVGLVLLTLRLGPTDREVFASSGSDSSLAAVSSDPSYSGTLLEAGAANPRAVDFYFVKVLFYLVKRVRR